MYYVYCYEAGLVVAVTLLATIALGILIIMLRLSRQSLSRQYADRHSSLSSHTRCSFNGAGDDDDKIGVGDDDDDDDMVQQLENTDTWHSVINVTINPVELLLQHQVL